MIFVYKDRIIHVEWTVFKGKTLVHEDFTRALIKVFLVGAGERYLLQARECRGTLYFDVEDGLLEGVYSLELIYVKNMGNLHCCKYNDRCFMRSRVDNAFAITDYQSEATDQYEDDVRLRYKSQVASYGYDGLSAYEIAVLRGDWNGTEGDWLEWVHQGIVDNVSRFINSVYLDWKGSAYKTRNSMPEAMRRKGIIISYRLPNGDIVTEKSATDSKEDILWGQDGVWERIDNLSLSGEISVSTNGSWVINGHDTGMLAVGPKGDNGLTPLIRTYENKLQYSYDGVEWKNASEDYIAAWFRWEDNKIQISRDQQNWSDLSDSFTNSLYIKGYAATTGELPSNPQLGDMYMVGPTYDESDSSHENPLYNLYVYTSSGWKDNGRFQSISEGVVQTTGSSTTKVMSQKAVTDELETLGTIEDNSEFLRAYTDAEGKFLWGIRVDGSIEWAKGIPTPVQNALKELESKLTDYTDEGIQELQTAIDVINAALKPLTDTFSYQDNPEFVNVVTDKEGKVLFGIKGDGKPYFPKNELYNVESNQEFLAVWLDAAGHVLFGLKQDGSTYVGKADFLDKIAEIQKLLEENGIGDSQLAEQVEQLQDDMEAMQDTFYHEENPEFAYVVTDAEGKVLFGIKTDGEPYYPNNEMYRVVQNNEYMAAWLDASDKVLFGIKTDGSVYIAKSELIDKVSEIAKVVNEMKPLAETFSIISNDEWLHAIVDAEGKLLFGIKAENGKVVMPKQDTYNIISNAEWLAAWVDASDKVLFGVKADGTFWAAKHNFGGSGSDVDAEIEEINNTISSMQNTLASLQETVSELQQGNEAMQMLSVIDDPEERTEVTMDAENKILSYRDKDGVKHEAKLDVEELYLSGAEFSLDDVATSKQVENLSIKGLDGVEDHSKENLLNVSEFTESFNDGTTTFSPPAENIALGYRLSNPIECKAGEWFTRNGTTTALIVNTNEADKMGERIPTPGASFQAIKDGYIRVTALNNGSVTLNRGKYVITDTGNFITIPTLKIQQNNMTSEVTLLRSPSGKYYQLTVSDEGVVSAQEVDAEIIQEYDLPADFPTFEINNIEGFDNHFDRLLIAIGDYLTELKAGGFCKYKYVGQNNRAGYDNFEHFMSSDSKERYGIIMTNNYKGLCIFDQNFSLIDRLEKPMDAHDFIYIDDGHYITYTSKVKSVEFDSGTFNVTGTTIQEYKNGELIASFDLTDDSILKDIILNTPDFGNEIHMNTLGFDKNGTDLLINLRNCDELVLVKRTVSGDNVTIGPVIGRCGGLHSNPNYNIDDRIKTDKLCQWFHAHDVKYWGDKMIDGINYPTYTLFDNNWRNSNNPRNNDSASGVENTNSRIVQLSIDWNNKLVKDYKVYTLDTWHYSNAMAGATMYDEGVISICWANMGTVGLYDFNQNSETKESGKLIVGAKTLWKIHVDDLTIYRGNTYSKL